MAHPPWWKRDLLPWVFTPWDQRSTRCPKCWYDMTGVIPNRCPECGAPWSEPGDLWRDGKIPMLVSLAMCFGAGVFLALLGLAADVVQHAAQPAATPLWVRILSYTMLIPFIPILFGVPMIASWNVRTERHASLRYGVCCLLLWVTVGAVQRLLPDLPTTLRWLGVI